MKRYLAALSLAAVMSTGIFVSSGPAEAQARRYRSDFDRDGIRNSRDRDIDGDGIPNARDRNDYRRDTWNRRPNVRVYRNDIDRDGVRNSRDRDIDGDGVRNSRDRNDYNRWRR